MSVIENGSNNSATTKSGQKSKYETKIQKENEVEVMIDVGAISPKHSDCNFDNNLRLTRALIANTLAAYCETEFSVFEAVKCVEVIGSTGINGLLWAKHMPEKIAVNINAPTERSYERIKENVERNKLGERIKITNQAPRVIMDENVCNFIHLECFSQAALYLDAAMFRLPRGGLLAISTVDDPALYCKTPEVAHRSYGGMLGKTSYYREMGARLIIAAIARSAARHNKAVRVLWVYTHKGLLSMVLQVDRGPVRANECLKKVRRLVHCNLCEDRTFLPQTNYLVAAPYSLLGCECQHENPGKTAVELGPVWSGELYDPEFLTLMLSVREKFPWAADVKDILDKMQQEALCPSTSSTKVEDKSTTSSDEPATKKAKLQLKFSESEIAPPFYFNLPKLAPKSPKMLKADRVVVCLRNSGFRASRTHFDLEAVKTNASLKEFSAVLEKGFLPQKEERNSADF